jgi:hypothetical protein
MVRACGSTASLAAGKHGWKQERDKQPNDGDCNQKLDERNSPTKLAAHGKYSQAEKFGGRDRTVEN